MESKGSQPGWNEEKRRDLRARRLANIFAGLDCPSDDMLASFADGSLETDAAEQIARHVERCLECRAVVSGFFATEANASIFIVPENLVEAAKSLGRQAVTASTDAGAPLHSASRPAIAKPFGLRIAAACAAAALLAAATILIAINAGRGKEENRAPARWNENEPFPGSAAATVDGSKKEIPEPEVGPGAVPEPVVEPEEVETPPAPGEKPAPGPSEEPGPEKPGPSEVEGPAEPGSSPDGTGKPGPSEVETPPQGREPGGTTAPVDSRRPMQFEILETRGQIYARREEGSKIEEVSAPAVLPFGATIAAPQGRHGFARLDSGFSLYLKASSAATLRPYEDGVEFELNAGEAAVEDSGGGKPLRVALASGWLRSRAGACFIVSRTNGKSTAAVIEDAVSLSFGREVIELEAGLSVTAGEGQDLKPRRFDANRAAEWLIALRPGTSVLRMYDFESGLEGWTGVLESSITFRHSQKALRAPRVRDKEFEYAVSKVEKDLIEFKPGVFVGFALWAEKRVRLGLRIWNKTRKQAAFIEIPSRPEGRWSRVAISLMHACAALPPNQKPAPGDEISGVVIGSLAGEGRVKIVVDDFAVFTAPPSAGFGQGYRPLPKPKGAPDIEADCDCSCGRDCACCRVAAILKHIKRFGPDGGDGSKKGQDDSKDGKKDGEDKDKDKDKDKEKESEPKPPQGPGPQEPPQSPPGPPGMPPGPFPPGPPPGMPPFPPQGPPPDNQPPAAPKGGDEKKGDDKDKDKDKEKPKDDPKKPKPEETAADAVAIHRWLVDQLPRFWPPYVGFKPSCCPQNGCKCMKAVLKWLRTCNLPQPSWKKDEMRIAGPFEAWIAGQNEKGK